MKFNRQQSIQEQLLQIPYARLIGIEPGESVDCFRLPARKSNIGNPLLPALHGGLIAGFMEMAATVSVLHHSGAESVPKIVDISVDYLRSGKFADSYARCQLHYLGRRMINVGITAWQEDESKPIATARAQFLVKA